MRRSTLVSRSQLGARRRRRGDARGAARTPARSPRGRPRSCRYSRNTSRPRRGPVERRRRGRRRSRAIRSLERHVAVEDVQHALVDQRPQRRYRRSRGRAPPSPARRSPWPASGSATPGASGACSTHARSAAPTTRGQLGEGLVRQRQEPALERADLLAELVELARPEAPPTRIAVVAEALERLEHLEDALVGPRRAAEQEQAVGVADAEPAAGLGAVVARRVEASFVARVRARSRRRSAPGARRSTRSAGRRAAISGSQARVHVRPNGSVEVGVRPQLRARASSAVEPSRLAEEGELVVVDIEHERPVAQPPWRGCRGRTTGAAASTPRSRRRRCAGRRASIDVEVARGSCCPSKACTGIVEPRSGAQTRLP